MKKENDSTKKSARLWFSEFSKIELLQMLKEEIYRLGLEKALAEQKIEELYDEENIPHPNSYINHFGTWQNVLDLLDLDNDWKERVSKANTGKRYASSWSNMDKEDVLDAIISEIKATGARDAHEYQAKRDRKNSPSVTTVRYLTGLTFSQVLNVYFERSGEMREEDNPSSLRWGDYSTEELIDITIDEMKRTNSEKYMDYNERRDPVRTPSITTIVKRGVPWSKIKKIYDERNGE